MLEESEEGERGKAPEGAESGSLHSAFRDTSCYISCLVVDAERNQQRSRVWRLCL